MIAIREEEGYCGVPITDTGKIGGKLLGIVTLRDIEPFLENESALTTSISQVMTTEVITASIGIPVSETFEYKSLIILKHFMSSSAKCNDIFSLLRKRRLGSYRSLMMTANSGQWSYVVISKK